MSLWDRSNREKWFRDKETNTPASRPNETYHRSNTARVGFTVSRQAHAQGSILCSFLKADTWDDFFEFCWKHRDILRALYEKTGVRQQFLQFIDNMEDRK